ncbi:WD40 repeat-like protein [Leucogyrophana mollusca]|uniref:WD40 repeat-like protein n=1 Tax=Leucogyrophana mollusca TaxID=85980 RepID=A0ACB8BSD5_9AGAM|nr:WD40 repeat-like protein [Leucogyrophana mollusca]
MSSRRTRFGPTDTLGSRDYEWARRATLDRTLVGGFPYSRKLVAHKSCVNALVFSRQGGRWLASAGDDFRIHLWDFHQDDLQKPSQSYAGPEANVLTIDFSATNQFFYCGGVDNVILKYDASQPPLAPNTPGTGSPLEVYGQHGDSVRGISCHPFQEDIFLIIYFALHIHSEDGMVILHDSRVDERTVGAQGTLQHTSEFTGVQAHPIMEHIFATSDAHGQVCLRDTRMAFGPLKTRTNEGIVQVYNTKLSKRSMSALCNPESSNIVFDRDGLKLAVTMLHYLPTIYTLSDPHPLAVCSGRNQPDGSPILPGQRTYSNSCTMKSGAFSSQPSQDEPLYATGSDDFRGYVWKVPPLTHLYECRKEIPVDEWLAGEWQNTVAFTQGHWQTRYVPMELSTPLCRLNGHKSIVNSVAVHPTLLHVVTAGIERDVILHSPTSASPSTQNLTLTPTDVRTLDEHVRPGDHGRFLRALLGPHPTLHEDIDGADDEDATISLFDHILREEGEADVFALRSWNENIDSEDSDEDSQMMLD